jgi:hypothetical protein
LLDFGCGAHVIVMGMGDKNPFQLINPKVLQPLQDPVCFTGAACVDQDALIMPLDKKCI